IAFRRWLTRKITEFQQGSVDEAEALQKARTLLKNLVEGPKESPEEPGSPTADNFIEQAGGTTSGLLHQVAELDALYNEATAVLKLPYEQFVSRIKTFNRTIAGHTNLMVHAFFPNVEKAQLREYAVQSKLAMVQAALAYRQSGEAGFEKVND